MHRSPAVSADDLVDQLLDHLADRLIIRLRSVLVSPEPALPKRAFRIPEVAKILSMSVGGVEQLVASGALGSLKIGRMRLIRVSDIDVFLEHDHPDI